MNEAAVARISVFPLTIPLREKVAHATSERTVADPVVVAVELNDGTVGYGETLARPYVTRENVNSVIESVTGCFATTLRLPDHVSLTAAR